MTHTVAFAGFRHAHIFDMYDRVRADGSFHIAACCEEDAETRRALAKEGRVDVTHDDFRDMLRGVDFDILMVGDYYGRRGALVTAALQAGKHVLSDKPVCTRMAELHVMERAAARGGVSLGAMLDLRDIGVFRRMREIVRKGDIGEVSSITFNGNHALLLGRRPSWYFEKDKQGGTINDLGIHAFDIIPWITGLRFKRIVAARTWATPGLETGFMKNASHVMAALENGCGVQGDLSYLVPDSIATTFPGYWRFSFAGSKGVVTGGYNDRTVTLFRNGEKEALAVAAAEPDAGGYLRSFLRELEGKSEEGDLTTRQVLDASRVSLLCQAAANSRFGRSRSI